MPAARLVELSGDDAQAFAHAQFGSDVANLAAADAQWSAWLDAQGRVRQVFLLIHAGRGHLVAWLPLGDAGAMARELARYVLRSRVAIRVPEGWRLGLEHAAPATPRVSVDTHAIEVTPPAMKPMRVRFLAPGDIPATASGGLPAALARAGIEAGLPWLAEELAGRFTGAALGLGKIGATRLDKGCYPGQEIVARLHYRGGNKRHCVRLRIAGNIAPRPGMQIIRIDDGAPAHCGSVLYGVALDDGSVTALAIIDETGNASAALQLEDGSHVLAISTDFTLAR